MLEWAMTMYKHFVFYTLVLLHMLCPASAICPLQRAQLFGAFRAPLDWQSHSSCILRWSQPVMSIWIAVHSLSQVLVSSSEPPYLMGQCLGNFWWAASGKTRHRWVIWAWFLFELYFEHKLLFLCYPRSLQQSQQCCATLVVMPPYRHGVLSGGNNSYLQLG